VSGVINPRNAKDNLSLWLTQALDQSVIVGISGMFGDDAAETSKDFPDGLMEFFFAGIPAENFREDWRQLFINVDHCLCVPI
jgi:hypothetical protein